MLNYQPLLGKLEYGLLETALIISGYDITASLRTVLIRTWKG
jgi:hypothetical protein